MTAPTPRTDAVNSATSTQSFEGLCRTLERELAQVTEAKNYHNNERIRIKQLAEEAEAENAELLALVERCRPAVEFVKYFGPETTSSVTENSALLREIDAALKEGAK